MSLSKGVLLRRTTAYLFLSNNNLQPSRPASRRLQRSDARTDKFLKASAAPLRRGRAVESDRSTREAGGLRKPPGKAKTINSTI
jgi:hypothetical protein